MALEIPRLDPIGSPGEANHPDERYGRGARLRTAAALRQALQGSRRSSHHYPGTFRPPAS